MTIMQTPDDTLHIFSLHHGATIDLIDSDTGEILCSAIELEYLDPEDIACADAMLD